VARHIFQACQVWIYTQSNITNIVLMMFIYFSPYRYALKVGAIFLPVLGITLTFAVLAVNEDLLVFHYLYAVLCCCQSLFVLLFYVAFDPKVKYRFDISVFIFHAWSSLDRSCRNHSEVGNIIITQFY
jgi:hypothetical protein